MRDAPAVHVGAAPLRAALERRHSLAGVEDAVGVERALHVMECGDLRRAKLHAHLAKLLDAHAVLARDGDADFDAALEDATTEFLAALELTGRVGIVEDARMDVAVARVEYVADGEPVFGGE